jgi:hypothetical protein
MLPGRNLQRCPDRANVFQRNGNDWLLGLFLYCHTPSLLGRDSCFGPGEESCLCFKVTSDGRIDYHDPVCKSKVLSKRYTFYNVSIVYNFQFGLVRLTCSGRLTLLCCHLFEAFFPPYRGTTARLNGTMPYVIFSVQR